MTKVCHTSTVFKNTFATMMTYQEVTDEVIMKHTILICLFALCSIILTGCVIVDDDCHYETKCSYVCDRYGNNCYYDDYCWDEWVCEDDYDYHRRYRD